MLSPKSFALWRPLAAQVPCELTAQALRTIHINRGSGRLTIAVKELTFKIWYNDAGNDWNLQIEQTVHKNLSDREIHDWVEYAILLAQETLLARFPPDDLDPGEGETRSLGR